MAKTVWCCVTLFILGTSFRLSSGHGRLLEPPSRSSLWRFPNQFPGAEPNYDDNGLNCGGMGYQQSVGGKCGICGDKWTPDSSEPRPNEAGGKYAKGIITRHYRPGALINVTIQVTVSHKGYFEFRICPNNDVTKPATQQCLDEHLLRFHDGTTKFYYGSKKGFYHMQVRLPAHVTCSQCVLQWKWTTGNSWGVSPSGEACVGCGPQEEFYGCSDISVGDVPGPSKNTTTTEKTTSAEQSADQPGQQAQGQPAQQPVDQPGQQAQGQPAQQPADQPGQQAQGQPAQQPADQPGQHAQGQPAQQPADQPGQQGPAHQDGQPQEESTQKPAASCHAFGVFSGDPSMENWCLLNCARGYCPSTHCSCDEEGQDRPTPLQCNAVGVWKAVSGMTEWCQLNCQLGYCPASHCLCT